ncbi:tRNA and rRNA cytosine-C5-methylase [Pseudoalteromonas luteoviolacea B = ATCC 29581]|nr:tRNA and rRNA cytosine-C5-methylase [Pseudoalteromonas luteoviolacea B = ATCC 29581]
MSDPYLVEQILTTLESVESQDNYADKVIEMTLKNHPEWNGSERGEYVTSCYGMLSLKRKLLAATGGDSNGWALWAAFLVLNNKVLPDWPELDDISEAQLLDNLQSASQAELLSYPDFINDIAQQDLGEQWPIVAKAMNSRPATYLRCNTLKGTATELQNKLETERTQTQYLEGDALKVDSGANIFKTKAFHDGWFEMQDIGSQQIAPLLDVKSGMRVADACCGAGGKSLHLAALMNNKGYVLALDIHEHKLTTLKKRAKRAGVHMIETRLIKNNKTIKRLKDKFDRVLLDVPCSGTGVFKRNPDAKWHLDEDGLNALGQLQREILQRYTQMCKPGGKVVYATCSILNQENRAQVDTFLANNPEFSLTEERQLLPGINTEGDGFYAAVLTRAVTK